MVQAMAKKTKNLSAIARMAAEGSRIPVARQHGSAPSIRLGARSGLAGVETPTKREVPWES
ncbi:MAG: hypothetical protein KC616_26030, partial [Myxococcales bacterium]|nr:hypothetical protein [Myxococcales bacterium]